MIMKNNYAKLFAVSGALFLVFSCKTKTPNKVSTTNNIHPTQAPAAAPTAYPTEPGTCVIQAYIIKIIPVDTTFVDEPCKSFQCKAHVIVTKSSACGFGVYKKPLAGDTLEVNFIHSLASSEASKKVYPARVNLPGLKEDQLFDAQIRIKLLPMEKLVYEIGNYDLVR